MAPAVKSALVNWFTAAPSSLSASNRLTVRWRRRWCDMYREGRPTVARRFVRIAVSVGVALTAALVSFVPPSSAQSGSAETLARLQSAAAIEGATRARLGVLGDAFTCADARFASFRRSDAEPQFADQWYVASQLWADARLLAVAAPATADGQGLLPDWDPQDTRCYIDKGFVFLDRLWDYSSLLPARQPVRHGSRERGALCRR